MMKSFGMSKKQPKAPSMGKASKHQAGASQPGRKGGGKKGK